MDAETFRREYRITTVRGRIVCPSEIWRLRSIRSLARALGVTREECLAVMSDPAWVRRYTGQIPARVGENAVFEAHARKHTPSIPGPRP